MSEEQPVAPNPPRWSSKGGRQEQAQMQASGRQSSGNALNRFLGGSPGNVFLRLLLVSLIVGAFLMWLDIRPLDVFRGIKQLIDRMWSLGFDAIHEIANYILAGAVLVIPAWLVLRLMNMRSER